MAVGYKELLAAAEAVVQSVGVAEAAELARDPQVLLVDIRDPRELEREGAISGALHAPRGMLEFWIDPESPYHKPVFAQDRVFVFFCAGGLRSLLAAKLAQEMGLQARSMSGGFAAWRAAGLPVGANPARG